MNLDRRHFTGALAGVAALAATGSLARAAGEAEPVVGDDGLFKQDWFIDSFLALKDDLAEAAEAGKNLAIIWEHRGCPYCRETHKVNFARPEIRDYIKANFNMLQLDLWGPRKVTDFDGEELGERELARKWGINFTPTIMFFPAEAAVKTGQNGRDLEVMRMPGYFKPFHFLAMFEYVRTGAYKTTPFQRFVQARGDKMREQGKKVDLW